MQEYAQGWSDYLAAWDKLMLDLLQKLAEDREDGSFKMAGPVLQAGHQAQHRGVHFNGAPIATSAANLDSAH